MEFTYRDIFEKEFKKLCKKYNSLKADFETFCLAIQIDPRGENSLENAIERVSDIGEEGEHLEFYKVRKFQCKSIARNSRQSGIRIVYQYIEQSGEIAFESIDFIEIFHKNDRENHDIQRIKDGI